jgi:cardiolipin synthase A/B
MRRSLSAAATLVLVAGMSSACKFQPGDLTASGAPSGGAAPSSGAPAAPSDDAVPAGTDALVTEPDQGLGSIYTLMRSAKHSLDMTMYELTDTQAEQILEQDAHNGVDVRVILDRNEEGQKNQAAYTALTSHGVHVAWAPSGFTVTHQKTITVDGDVSAVMTLNLTPQYYSTSRDFAVIDRDPADVAAIEQVFAADFADRPVTAPPGADLVWSPTQSNTDLIALINSATKSLLVENEEMSDSAVVNALISAARRGVRVEVVMTDSSSWKSNFDKLASAGVKVSTYSADASLYIHAKIILVDDAATPTRTTKVFIGSENFSTTSLDHNRELGLIITDPAVLSAVDATVSKDFAGATPWS